MSWVKGDRLPRGLIPRMRAISSSQTSEKEGVPDVEEIGRNRVGVTAGVCEGRFPLPHHKYTYRGTYDVRKHHR